MAFLENYRAEYARVMAEIDLAKIGVFIDILREARDNDRQIFAFGNGGSAAIASHFAVDMAKGASYGHSKRFRFMALTDQMETITAYSNDVGYDVVFKEQLANFARQGDVVIAISASGNSPNVLRGIEYANSIGCTTIALTGCHGGKLAGLALHSLVTPSDHVGQIEDSHMCAVHMMAYYFMERHDEA